MKLNFYSKNCMAKEFINHNGRGYTPYLTITVKVISEESGRCEETVRRHIKRGNLDPYSLDSIVKWIIKHSKEITLKGD